MKYPNTKKVDAVDSYFGIKIHDPFRWLEDDRSPETENWVKQQNETTFNYLDKIPFRKELKKRLEQLWNFEKLGSPFKEGDYIYFFKNDGLQNQNVLYRKKGDDGQAEVFLDPNSFSADATTSLAGINFSKDGSIAAYSISEGGSDWRKVIVINAENKSIVEDTLVDIKFSGVSWKGNEGFYYSSYDKPEGSELSAKTDQHKLYYHKLGTPQKSDEVVFGGIPEEKHRYVGGYVTEDDRYLIISAAVSTSGNKLFIKDLTQQQSELITILDTTDSDSQIIDNIGSKLFILTNRN
ncbi:MAG: S9 family peptidase, partial [Arenibacter troitsensis]|nr:S9 family peptidase [Arenibacter troitsensis]